MDNLEFLDSPEGENAETQPETVEQPTDEAQPQTEAAEPENQEPSTERPRDEHGRFTKREAEPVMVPLAALHETRDKLRLLEAELMQMRQPQQQQPQMPDVFEDTAGYTATLQTQMGALVANATLNMSEEFTRQQAGDETVNAAQEWGRQMIASSPAFAQAFYQQRNPYGFLVQAYQRQQSLSRIGDDPKDIEDYLAWKNAQAQLQQPAQANHPTQGTPTRSIASATSAGGGVQHSAVGPGVAFSEIFK